MTPTPAFEILPPDAAPSPIVVHLPHASRHVPPAERARLALDDAALAAELLRLTDAHTDRLFAPLAELGATRFVNRISRLVVDPERFPEDAAEPMSAVGQGAVYTRTTTGEKLRDAGPRERERLIDAWYAPYHAALTRVVGATVSRSGSCLIVDGHSFASVPLPTEPDQDPDRPDVCLGTDPFHTPPALVAALEAALDAQRFRVAVDRPFSGALVPRRWYRRDPRVTAVMLEIRRGTYMDEATGERLPAFDAVAARLGRAVARALAVD